MTDDMREYLQEEVLGECWHESDSENAVGKSTSLCGIELQVCKKCGAVMSSTYAIICTNRTFTTRDDMMDLYQALHTNLSQVREAWNDFSAYMHKEWPRWDNYPKAQNFAAWLFCLDGRGYEERCQMVYELLNKK